MALDKGLHAANMVVFEHHKLKEDNIRLQTELETAKRMLLRMDADRLGLKKVVDHLRSTWSPDDPANPQEKLFKQDDQEYRSSLLASIRDVFADENYKKQRQEKLQKGVEADVADALDAENRMNILKHAMYRSIPKGP